MVITIAVNLDDDWSQAEQIPLRKSKSKWCTSCRMYHNLSEFFKHHGSQLGCMYNRAHRSAWIGKVKRRGQV